MKRPLTLIAFLGAVAGRGEAQTNPLSFADGRLVLDLEERLRFEVRENNFDFNDAVDATTDDAYLLQRFRLGLLVKPVDRVRVYVQGQDSREIDSARDDVPFVLGAEGDDPFDLRQASVEIADPAQCPWSLKVGRQELLYGDERLIGRFDWNNFSRTFDAVKVRYQDDPRQFWADAFAAHVVTIHDFGPQDNTEWQFNDANWNDTLAGLYAGMTRLKFQTTEAYFLYRNKESNNPRYIDDATPANAARPYDIKQEIYTVGLRLKSTPDLLHGFDYEAEAAYQWGRAAGRLTNSFPNAAGVALDHAAWAAMIRGGYAWTDCPGKPRLGAEYSVSSGDESQDDRQDQSFLNLFPTNHKFYGYMDLFAWKNVHNPSVQLKVTPYQDSAAAWRNLWVQLDYHAFWLFTNEDAWYRANAVSTVRAVDATARAADRFVGSELDLTVGYAPWKWLKLLAGYSHFFSGDYVRATGPDDDADFGYLQTVVSF